jgi:hypothetical protein
VVWKTVHLDDGRRNPPSTAVRREVWAKIPKNFMALMVLNLLYERTLGKPTIGQLANNQQREFKFPNEGFFPMTRGRFPSDISKLDSHK